VSAHDHGRGPRRAAIGLLTVSDSRTVATDLSGAVARRLLEADGHGVVVQRILPDEPDRVAELVHEWLGREDCDVVLVSGGTGVSARDRTYEAVTRLLDQRLDGFGELFRMLSWQAIGSAAMLSRAVGGIARGKPLFALPGAPAAVELALGRLILPELAHLLSELDKHR
jgi:molybdenum cofactor biosynthesis protein B